MLIIDFCSNLLFCNALSQLRKYLLKDLLTNRQCPSHGIHLIIRLHGPQTRHGIPSAHHHLSFQCITQPTNGLPRDMTFLQEYLLKLPFLQDSRRRTLQGSGHDVRSQGRALSPNLLLVAAIRNQKISGRCYEQTRIRACKSACPSDVGKMADEKRILQAKIRGKSEPSESIFEVIHHPGSTPSGIVRRFLGDGDVMRVAFYEG